MGVLSAVSAPERPDWRWDRVLKVPKGGPGFAKLRSRGADPVMLRAQQYWTAADRRQGEAADPALHMAYEIYATRPAQRVPIESCLLNGVTKARIATLMRLPDPEVIQLYHDLFFDVDEAVQNNLWGWVDAAVFNNQLYTVRAGDSAGVSRRLGWLMRPLGSFDTARIDPTSPEAMGQLQRLLVTAAANRGFETLISDHIDEGGIALIKLPFDIASAEAKARGSKGPATAREEDIKAIASFIEGVPISVADPTDPANLALSAREPRETDYVVQGH